MLKDLRKYEHLGNPVFFYRLIKFIKSQEPSSTSNEKINKYFYSKIIDGRRGFNGAIEFAIEINILMKSNNIVTVNNDFFNYYKFSQNLELSILKNFFYYINNSEDVSDIFKSNNFEFIYNTKELVITNSAFQFKYSNIKNFLIDFGFLVYNEDSEGCYYNINNKYFSLIDNSLFPDISRKKRKVSVNEFEKSIESKNKYGYEAELFVYEFEKMRLLNLKTLDWTSLHTVNEGYDITSYDTVDDFIYNRFIEVKSYDGENPYFFLSQNEYDTAEKIRKNYWLYIVNRRDIQKGFYQPIMIQDPFESLFSNPNWKVSEEKTYKFSLNT